MLPLHGRPLDLILARYPQRRLHCRHVFHGRRCAPGHTLSKRYGCVGDFQEGVGDGVQERRLPPWVARPAASSSTTPGTRR